MSTKRRVAVFMGGIASEHDISLSSGRQVLDALDGPLPVLIERDGAWVVDGQSMSSMGEAVDRVVSEADVAFLALHGRGGEDGTIQGLLECVGLPYVGSGVLGSALSMDKIRTKMVYRAAGLPTPSFEVIRRETWGAQRQDVLDAITGSLGVQCVLKRAREGSSYGIAFPKTSEELEARLEEFFERETILLAEKLVRGKELTCGVLDFAERGRSQALPVTEIVPGDKYEFFDLEAKYTPGATEEITPARISSELAVEVQRLAVQAHQWLDCRDFSRSDVLIDAEGRPQLIETNTIPGLTPTSLLPQAAEVAGYDFRALVEVLVGNARFRAGR